MACMFDNIEQDLLTALRGTMNVSQRSDFCVGYLNSRGWQAIDDLVAPWEPAEGQVCRVMVGMQRPPHDEIRELYRQSSEDGLIDDATASCLAHLYGLTEAEFAHILCTFPLVTEPTKIAALNAWRDVERGLIQ